MKKISAVILSLILLFSCAYAAETEITFQNIPWLSDDITTIQALTDAGHMKPGAVISLDREDQVYLLEDETGFISPDHLIGAEDVTFMANLGDSVRGKIAGYPLKDVKLSFAYDGAYKLLAIEVELINADYATIKEKLTKVYGESQETVTDEGITSTVWKGENNTAVLLYTQSDGFEYTLMYGSTDAASIISACLTTDLEDVSGL